MFSKIKSDLPASLVVFLVALPLCLGIALASGAPLISGLITGIVGGILVGAISGSHTSVTGPAAGLTAVVLTAISQLGSFDVFLTAVVIAGAIQLGLGLLRAGFIAAYIPSTVIKGLLAAIGVILILKQIPHAVGYDADAEGDFSFHQIDGENTLSDVLSALRFFSIGSTLICAVSLLMLIYWDKTPLRKIKFIPASLVVVIMGVGINVLLAYVNPAWAVAQEHLVKLPSVSLAHIESSLRFPAWGAFTNPQVWAVGFTIAIVASIETLLNLEAVDNIDVQKRRSPPNRELIAQGIGNMVVGMIGGIPLTSVVVRGSVNVYAGAQSKLSTVIHGVLLLLSILVLTPILNLIPLAALAAILLVTGYKLTRISIFKEMYSRGLSQLIPFTATILAIVFTDLLVGVMIGLGVSILFILRSNFRNPFILEKQKLHLDDTMRLELSNQVTFLNKAHLKSTLWSMPDKSKVIIDATVSNYIDHDVLDMMREFKDTVAPQRGIELNIVGLKKKYKFSDQVEFVTVLDKQMQLRLNPESILNILKDGNARFINGKRSHKYLSHQVNATSTGQYPMAVVLSCIDSRTSPELIFDSGMGDLLSIRIAGNIVSDEIVGSIELACQEIHTKLIVVMGHSNCGAVSSAITKLNIHHIGAITGKIGSAIYTVQQQNPTMATHDKSYNYEVTIANIKNSADEILSSSEYLRAQIKTGEVGIVAAYYNTETGKVIFYPYELNKQPAQYEMAVND
jgi:carbonic anhydrase